MAPLVPYRDRATDNSRWEHFTYRPDDIFICTPAKCGTTWTQTIVASLLFPDGATPSRVLSLSPWLDGRMFPLEVTLERLEQQTHRRFIKSHTPADGIPIWPEPKYIVVYRDGRDAFMSLLNHEDHMRPEAIAQIDADARAAGGKEIDRSGDVHERFARWLPGKDNAIRHLATWWPHRDDANVLFVHYNDLKVDLSGEMQRIASFLDVDVDSAQWDEVVARCTFEAMKGRANDIGPFDAMFEGGADAFLFKGTNGRWRDVLSADDLARYADVVAAELDANAAAWFEHGSLALGIRPGS